MFDPSNKLNVDSAGKICMNILNVLLKNKLVNWKLMLVNFLFKYLINTFKTQYSYNGLVIPYSLELK